MFDGSNARFWRGREGRERERERERERRGIRGVTACPLENDSVQSQYLLVDSEK
jgi:hypothetical protein